MATEIHLGKQDHQASPFLRQLQYASSARLPICEFGYWLDLGFSVFSSGHLDRDMVRLALTPCSTELVTFRPIRMGQFAEASKHWNWTVICHDLFDSAKRVRSVFEAPPDSCQKVISIGGFSHKTVWQKTESQPLWLVYSFCFMFPLRRKTLRLVQAFGSQHIYLTLKCTIVMLAFCVGVTKWKMCLLSNEFHSRLKHTHMCQYWKIANSNKSFRDSIRNSIL